MIRRFGDLLAFCSVAIPGAPILAALDGKGWSWAVFALCVLLGLVFFLAACGTHRWADDVDARAADDARWEREQRAAREARR